VPKMLEMIEKGQGVKKGIPQLIIAGSSLDDVAMIVIFTALTTVATGGSLGVMTFIDVPLSIILGIGAGVAIGLLLSWLFKKIHIRDSVKVMIICGFAFGLYGLEVLLEGIVGFSGLLASMTIGITILAKNAPLAERLSSKYSKLWLVADIMLFVLVGASVDLNYFFSNLGLGILLIVIVLVFRSAGVYLSLIGTNLNKNEKLFTVISYIPKATVQAAIGAIPMAMGIPGGELILSIAVISILFTSPLGALGMDLTVNKLIK